MVFVKLENTDGNSLFNEKHGEGSYNIRINEMKKCDEEIYEVLDEMNARIETIFNEYNDTDSSGLILSMLHEKVQYFLYELEAEIEKFGHIKMEVLQ